MFVINNQLAETKNTLHSVQEEIKKHETTLSQLQKVEIKKRDLLQKLDKVKESNEELERMFADEEVQSILEKIRQANTAIHEIETTITYPFRQCCRILLNCLVN